MFSIYFELGLRHIADLEAFDHMLFILTLVAVYQIKDFKKILILVTAFTLGHSLTLALGTLQIMDFSIPLIEFLIPVTILITAFSNLFAKSSEGNNLTRIKYLLALIFGLIHGLGFSNYLRALLGKESSITGPLFAFNVGIEVGQLIIVFVVLVIAFIFLRFFGVKQRDWVFIISGISMGMALLMMRDTVFW